MAGTSSEVEIANLALSMIGEEPILSFTDDNVAARYVNLIYVPERDAELRKHTWNFAVTRATLSKSATSPKFGYKYQYKLPPDFLRLIEFNGGDDDYRPEGEFILTDADTAEIIYVARVEDTTKFDALFVQALAARLAMKLAEPVAGDTEKVEQMRKEYEQIVADARSVDAMESPPVILDADDFIDARYRGRRQYRAIQSA